MNSKNQAATPVRRGPLASAVCTLLLAAALLPGQARAQANFATPEKAAEALIRAVAVSDPDDLSRVLGKGWRELIGLDEPNIKNRYTFLEMSSQKQAVETQGTMAHLVVGADPWTLPIPIMQGKDGQWRFDPVRGRDEIATRRLGANELAAMQVMLAYVDAQLEYALADRNGDGVLEYAQKLLSSPGKRDGLIWTSALGDESPLGEAIAPPKRGQGYHGYHFRVLTGQGPAAPGGARSYLIGPRMVSGFALLAWPVEYGKSGVMSFIVNQRGKVFERDLGPKSAEAAAAIKQYDPGEGWKPAQH